jgi:4-hydroxybenzoate polyprenyltransferase
MIAALRRFFRFVDERFPLLPSLVAAALMGLSASVLGARALHRPAHVDGDSVVLVLVVLALLFVVRVVDDLRDLDHDRRHHPDRPLPRGAVLALDLVVVGTLITSTVFAMVFIAFSAASAMAVAAVVALTVALQLDGGSRALAHRPIATLVVHQPMVALWAVLVACVSTSTTLTWSTASALAPVAALAVSLSVVFELGRDMAPANGSTEGSYVALWGAQRTAAALAGFCVAAGAIVAWLAVLLRLAWWSVAVPAVSLLVVVGACMWFAHAQTRRRAQAVVVSSAAASLWVYLPLIVGALRG